MRMRNLVPRAWLSPPGGLRHALRRAFDGHKRPAYALAMSCDLSIPVLKRPWALLACGVMACVVAVSGEARATTGSGALVEVPLVEVQRAQPDRMDKGAAQGSSGGEADAQAAGEATTGTTDADKDDTAKAGDRRKGVLFSRHGSIPDDPAARARLLGDLYAFLATAETEASAKRIAAAIERVWLVGAGDTVRVLIQRAADATAKKDSAFALKMLDAVTAIAPDFPEGFNRRAYLHYKENNVRQALGDLRRVLALDPNHYKALDGLGQILREMGRKQEALQVYRKLLDVHPFWEGARSVVLELERAAEGQEL